MLCCKQCSVAPPIQSVRDGGEFPFCKTRHPISRRHEDVCICAPEDAQDRKLQKEKKRQSGKKRLKLEVVFFFIFFRNHYSRPFLLFFSLQSGSGKNKKHRVLCLQKENQSPERQFSLNTYKMELESKIWSFHPFSTSQLLPRLSLTFLNWCHFTWCSSEFPGRSRKISNHQQK